MTTQQIIGDSKAHLEKAMQHLETELSKVRAGKISVNIIDGITVDYYGSHLPINQAANVSVADARTMVIQPWEKKMLEVIEKAILAANIGITPYNDGNVIKLYQPPLTEERRKEFVKKAHQIAETARVSVRSIRRDAVDHIKRLGKEHVSEDQIKDAEAEMQDITNKFIAQIDKHVEVKEKEIMTV
jgi:ribosome recycling factor